jgi:hypothetical protein
MKTQEVSAKSPKLERESVAYVEVPETVEEAVEAFGGDAVCSNAIANWVVTLQAGMRRMHTAGKTDEEIQESMAVAKMGVATSGGRIDPIQASLAKFKTMNVEEQADYLEKLRQAAETAE